MRTVLVVLRFGCQLVQREAPTKPLEKVCRFVWKLRARRAGIVDVPRDNCLGVCRSTALGDPQAPILSAKPCRRSPKPTTKPQANDEATSFNVDELKRPGESFGRRKDIW